MKRLEMILFCNCGYSEIIDHSIRADILDKLADTGCDFEVVQDLCELAAKKDPKFKRWAQADSLTIVACYPRTLKWLFSLADAELDTEKTQFLNMRTSTAEEILASLLGKKTPVEDKRKIQLEEKGDWIPWFPVIDYDRCKNCMQCLNFCLFGVYELSENEQVQVTNPAGCKTNCPACARLCPHNAIIFPKYPDSPINGDDVDESKKTELNPDEIYKRLKRRSKTKKRFEKDRAGREEIDLTRLKDQLGIPSEVLESLKPSDVTELRKKSEKKNRE
ncbi:MAG: ferredoxin family protein [Phycisphaerae bacterium]|nr:ferredoxin family protein [Phycisphaerae bacterium]